MQKSKLTKGAGCPLVPLVFTLLAFLVLGKGVHAQQVQTEELEVRNGEIRLPGTLRVPAGTQAHPLLIFIPGSGNIDRDGNQAGTMIQPAYIRQLGEALASRGLAFFSYDKRTAVPENKAFLDTVLLKDYVSDVQTLLKYFEKDARFSGIHLLGHSQGSLVGMLSLSESTPVRSLVSIAGPASPIDSVMLQQLEAQSPELAREAATHLDQLKKGGSPSGVSPLLQPLFAPANLPILREWMAYHPVEVFSKVGIPALLVYGEEDTQVSPEAGERFKKVRPGARYIRIPGMNHVLKQLKSPSDNLRAYTDSSMPVSAELVRELVEWIDGEG